MSISALSSAVSGLASSQNAIDVVSNNIANVKTDGYTHKQANQTSKTTDFAGVGVRTNNITRYVNQTLLRDYRTQISLDSYLTTRASSLEPIANFHGDPQLQTNFHGYLNDLKSSFSALATDPTSFAVQNQVINNAQTFANKMNSLSDLILAQRTDVETSLDEAVDDINTLLKTVEEYNRRIGPRSKIGESTAELADRRDAAVKQLAEYMDITYFEDGDGFLNVQTNKGHVLVNKSAKLIEFNRSAITHGSTYPFSLSGALLRQSSSNETIDLASFEIGGKLGALFNLRDNTLPTYQAFNDELAHKTALRFAEEGLTLFTDKSGGVPPDNPEQYFGFAASIQVSRQIIESPSLLQSGTRGTVSAAGDAKLPNVIVDHVFGLKPSEKNILIPAAPALSSQILSLNPDAYWRFNDASGTTALNQGAGGAAINGTYQNGVTLNAPPLYNNGSNSSAQFDGIDDYVAIPDSNLINTSTVPERTVELVFNADTVSGRQVLYEEGGSTNNLSIYIDNGSLYMVARDQGDYGPFNISTPINAGETYHAAFVLDTVNADTFTAYLNGVAFGSGAAPTIFSGHSDDVGIGAKNNDMWFHDGPSNGGIDFFFQGRISDVALHNTSLTSAQLLSHAQSLNSVNTTTNEQLKAAYNFRTEKLGAYGNLSLDTLGNGITILDFAKALVLRQTGDYKAADTALIQESAFKNEVEQRLLNSSGVDIDEELSSLIKYERSYQAAGQMIATLDEMFQELLNTF